MQKNPNIQAVVLLLIAGILFVVGYQVGKENGFKKGVGEVCRLADYKTEFCQTFLKDFVLPEAERSAGER